MNLDFTLIDGLVALTLLVSASYAAYRGFVSEALSVVAWLAAAFAMLYFAPSIVPYFRLHTESPLAGTAVAYAGVFLVVFIPLSFMSHRFSESVRNSEVNALDRALGFVFGVVRGLVIVGFAYMLFSTIISVREQPHWIRDARSLPLIQGASHTILTLLPNQKSAVFAQAESTAPGAADTAVPAVVPLPRPETEAAAGPAGVPRRHLKSYRADERRELDRLIETTGSSKQ
jgi:membrane protein required for colicin V production